MTAAEQPATLRERKKLRTRQALIDTAVTLFGERGFDNTPLDALLEQVEVSRRTFFRNFQSKEDVALAAVKQLWDVYLEVLDGTTKAGPLADVFLDAMLTTLERMDADWYRRFPRTLRLVADSPALDGHTLRHCAEVQAEIVRRLDRPDERELRLLIEFFVAAWRRALDEWLPDCPPGELPTLLRHTCAAMDTALRLEA
ncbi:TetR family transcriptional regulator [Streptomyces sp. DSM 44915]|uniref:TetR family transcriptional regulator n=1 Tax=Streptomyces chisholmiae TaxID=3075540 RepID=A0ABU2JU08_9ACTN|nr:TetR family transcriptional regulator [Streptomyces sp. DSM 44915]MDT0267683.1 TetR family transcriptional regulator [Streptomyces sp. DSM 44915]